MSALESIPRTIQAIRPETVLRVAIGRPGLVLDGKYRLEERIADGGCASIWSATHVTLDRPVAVKFIETQMTGRKEDRVDRFLREAKVAASIRHKNVVDILDFGVGQEGISEPYMIMELLDGKALDVLLSQTALSTYDTVGIIRQVLSGLDAVHAAGIVHRDMKPGNVFVTEDGDGLFARVLDFGISQGADEVDDHIVVGTPEYMSPEQAYGRAIDWRSDLYSVGVMLYEMLGKQLPFVDPDPVRVLQLLVENRPTSIASLRPELPALCEIIETAMSSDPSHRFQSAREMQRALLDAIGLVDPSGHHAPARDELRESGQFQRDVHTLDEPMQPVSELADVDAPERDRLTMNKGPARLAAGLIALAALVGIAITWNLTHASSAPIVVSAPVLAETAAVLPAVVAEAVPVRPESAPAVPTLATVDPIPAAPVPARVRHPRAPAAAPRGQITRELDF